MEVILLNDVDHLGYKHDRVAVKNGYGRNYLIPQGLAVIANAANLGKLDKLIAAEEAKEAAKVDDYKKMASDLEGKSINIAVKAGTSGKIFGSVTNIQIANALKEQLGLDIERKKISLPEEIKEMGEYKAVINFYKEISAEVDLNLKQD